MSKVLADIASTPDFLDEAFIRLADWEVSMLEKPGPNQEQLEDLYRRPAFKYFVARVKREANQAMTNMATGRGAPPNVHDALSYHIGLAAGLRLVLSLRRQLYERAGAIARKSAGAVTPEANGEPDPFSTVARATARTGEVDVSA